MSQPARGDLVLVDLVPHVRAAVLADEVAQVAERVRGAVVLIPGIQALVEDVYVVRACDGAEDLQVVARVAGSHQPALLSPGRDRGEGRR